MIVTTGCVEDLLYEATWTLKSHNNFLQNLGIIVNIEKTEIMVMKNRDNMPRSLLFGDREIVLLDLKYFCPCL